MVGQPVFARDRATRDYYQQRAAEYDDWYESRGRFAERDRPGWAQGVQELVELVRGLPPRHTLDVACGSGYLTRHLQGSTVALDQSPAMVGLTRGRLSRGYALVGNALQLPFPDGTFDRVLTGHFYGHLPPDERQAFLAEARRVAAGLVVIDSAARDGVAGEQWQQRVLNDGSRHRVYKRYLDPNQLADEIGGEVLFAGTWFVAAQA